MTCPNSPRTPPGHYWLVEPAISPTSQSVCVDCGATREWKNSILDDPDWKRKATITKKAQADLLKARREFDASRISRAGNWET